MGRHRTLQRIYLRLESLNVKINENNEKIDLILKILRDNISEKCKKMEEHIDFVENVYDAVKNPLGYICNTINGNTILPAIESSPNETDDKGTDDKE